MPCEPKLPLDVVQHFVRVEVRVVVGHLDRPRVCVEHAGRTSRSRSCASKVW